MATMTDAEVVHLIADGEAVTLCCGRTPFELPRTERLTVDPALVNCPAMVITDEAVAAAAREFFGGAYGAVGDEGNQVLHDSARVALAAALPHLAPQPVVDREAVEVEVCKVIADFFRDDEGFTSYHASSLTARLLPLLTGGAK